MRIFASGVHTCSSSSCDCRSSFCMQDLKDRKGRPFSYTVEDIRPGLVSTGQSAQTKPRHVTGEMVTKQQLAKLVVKGVVDDWPIEGVLAFDPTTQAPATLLLDQFTREAAGIPATGRALPRGGKGRN